MISKTHNSREESSSSSVQKFLNRQQLKEGGEDELGGVDREHMILSEDQSEEDPDARLEMYSSTELFMNNS